MRNLCLAIPLILAYCCHADTVLWDYSLEELPPGWTVISSNWTFSSEGMNYYCYSVGGLDILGDIETSFVEVPLGTDSLSFIVDQNYQGFESWGTVYAKILFRPHIGPPWIEIWDLSGTQSSSTPISIAITEISPEEQYKFIFRGHTNASGVSGSGAELDWTLHNLQLIAHGGIQNFTHYSWGSIKKSWFIE